jgi:arylsulfatase A-like enzyme
VHDKATKVPLLVHGPKTYFSAIRKVQAPVELLDLAPTVYELTGFQSSPTNFVQGLSLIPLIPVTPPVTKTKALALPQFTGFRLGLKKVMSFGSRGVRYRLAVH